MQKFINKEDSYKDSPITDENWKKKSNEERINTVKNFFQKKEKYVNFEVIQAYENGHVILKTELNIEAHKRGVLLLNLEEELKTYIDLGITVWLEPVGDKSKLRNLRGIEIKT